MNLEEINKLDKSKFIQSKDLKENGLYYGFTAKYQDFNKKEFAKILQGQILDKPFLALERIISFGENTKMKILYKNKIIKIYPNDDFHWFLSAEEDINI